MMRLSRRGVCRLGLAGAAFGMAAPSLAGNAEGEVAALADEFLHTQGMPGLSIAYLQAGEFRLQAAYGLADEQRNEKLAPRHRFRLASLSKTLTAAVVLDLAFQGKLALDGRVFGADGILGAVQAPADGGRWLDEITVDHLLSHRSGGWSNEGQPDPMFLPRYLGLNQTELIATTLSDMPVQSRPGTRFAYSNFGYVLLGRVIEAATGQPYAAAVWENLLLPAGLNGFEIGGDTLEMRKPDEVRYHAKYDNPYELPIARLDAAGGWIANAADVAWLFGCMDGKRSPPDVVDGKTVAWMAKPGEPSGYYGRGLKVNPQHGNRWNVGSLPGVTTFAVMVERGDVFVGLTNGYSPQAVAALETLLWQIYDILQA